MTLTDYCILGIFAAAFGMQFFLKKYQSKYPAIYRTVFFISIAVVFGFALYWSIMQYSVWKNSPASAKYLLPPYQEINYFIEYAFTRFWAPHLISLAMSLLAFFGVKYFNKKYEERFLEREECYFLALAIFLTSHPGWITYLILTLFISLLSSAIYSLKNKDGRLSLYYFWLPTAFFTIIINKCFVLHWVQVFKI
ncbi:MAG: hypothetical protein PHN74_02690 [Candidatus Pacebacteria bacterium]|nr:hypothetical protein [Candidatus Paceibacterota bacterium]